jgi:hypothetical protein
LAQKGSVTQGEIGAMSDKQSADEWAKTQLENRDLLPLDKGRRWVMLRFLAEYRKRVELELLRGLVRKAEKENSTDGLQGLEYTSRYTTQCLRLAVHCRAKLEQLESGE